MWNTQSVTDSTNGYTLAFTGGVQNSGASSTGQIVLVCDPGKSIS